MDLATLLLLAIGLSMDAFAVSICKGLATKQLKASHMLIVGAWFGGFQALMPMIGYLLGSRFVGLITNITPWIAFALLTLIGVNMIREAFSKEEKEETSAAFGFKTMLVMAIATSIDALAVGIIFADFVLRGCVAVLRLFEFCVEVELRADERQRGKSQRKKCGKFFHGFIFSNVRNNTSQKAVYGTATEQKNRTT